jgi:hypothetical protein
MHGDETGTGFAARFNSGVGLLLIVLWAAVTRWDRRALIGRAGSRRRGRPAHGAAGVIDAALIELAPDARVPAPPRAPARNAPPAELAPGVNTAFMLSAGDAWPAGLLALEALPDR